MACGEEMTDLTEEEGDQIVMGAIARLSLDSSPVLAPKEPRFAKKFSLRELEIQQTVGESEHTVATSSLSFLPCCMNTIRNTVYIFDMVKYRTLTHTHTPTLCKWI